MRTKKTDNSFTEEKLKLRQKALSMVNNNEANVLDCYAGKGQMWNELKKRNKEIKLNILQIEKEEGKNKKALKGDNIKFLRELNLSKYDIIDLDAYGIPYQQIRTINERGYHGIVVVTAIVIGIGRIPNGLLEDYGYTKKMIDKCPTLLCGDHVRILKSYLYNIGVRKVWSIRPIDNKYYFVMEV